MVDLGAITLLKSEEARRLIVGPDAEPRFSRSAWHRLIAAGTIPAIKLGGKYFVSLAALLTAFGGAS